MKELTEIQKSARGERCTAMIEDVICSGPNTTVLAHKTSPTYPNSPRRCDARAAYTCGNCHDVFDGRTPYQWAPYQEEATWARAIERTHVKLMEKDLLKFEGLEIDFKILPRRLTW